MKRVAGAIRRLSLLDPLFWVGSLRRKKNERHTPSTSTKNHYNWRRPLWPFTRAVPGESFFLSSTVLVFPRLRRATKKNKIGADEEHSYSSYPCLSRQGRRTLRRHSSISSS